MHIASWNHTFHLNFQNKNARVHYQSKYNKKPVSKVKTLFKKKIVRNKFWNSKESHQCHMWHAKCCIQTIKCNANAWNRECHYVNNKTQCIPVLFRTNNFIYFNNYITMLTVNSHCKYNIFPIIKFTAIVILCVWQCKGQT